MTAKVELLDLQILEGSFVDKGDNPEAHIAFFKCAPEQADKAHWTTAQVNELPDSSFLYIEAGGTKDEDGKTVPRSLRHFPVKGSDGMVDLPHLRNALSRIPQSTLPDSVKETIAEEARMMLERAQKNGEEYEGEQEPKVPRTLAQIEGEQKIDDAKQKMMQSVYEILDAADPAMWPSMISQSVSHLADMLSAMGHNVQKISVRKDGSNTVKATETGGKMKTIEEILASLPEAERAVVSARLDETTKAAAAGVEVEKRLVDLEKRAADAEAEVNKMRDEKLTAAFVVKAKEIGGGDVAQMATLLKAAYGRSEEEGRSLETMFRAMATQAKLGASLFKTVGSSAAGVDDASPEAMIEAETQKILKADPTVGYHAAYRLALGRNRDAYAKTLRPTNIE